jgi:hypothetical protein
MLSGQPFRPNNTYALGHLGFQTSEAKSWDPKGAVLSSKLGDKGFATLGITLYEGNHWCDHQSAHDVTHLHISWQPPPLFGQHVPPAA